jgi:hypothetical protein
MLKKGGFETSEVSTRKDPYFLRDERLFSLFPACAESARTDSRNNAPSAVTSGQGVCSRVGGAGDHPRRWTVAQVKDLTVSENEVVKPFPIAFQLVGRVRRRPAGSAGVPLRRMSRRAKVTLTVRLR